MVNTKYFIGAAALSAPLVAGHGYMGLPKVSFPKGGDITAPAGTINSSQFKAPSGMSFTTDPESNTKAFSAWIKTSEFKSLKDLIEKKGNIDACGNSAVADPQPLPDQVEWTHGASEGFTASHQGPCEVWCDNKMAFHDDNCAKNYPAAPAKLPYDKSKCAGAKKLTTYWLALHDPNWQMYVNCAALSGAGASSGGAASPTPSSGTTPTVKPSKPSTPASTPAPAPAPATGDDADEDCDEEYPEPAGGDADEDCDEEYPEPTDSGEVGGDADVGNEEDCDEEYPEPTEKPTEQPASDNDDCDEEYPEPAGGDADEDCDEEYPEPTDKARSIEDEDDEKVDTSNLNFGALNGEDAPGKVSAEDY